MKLFRALLVWALLGTACGGASNVGDTTSGVKSAGGLQQASVIVHYPTGWGHRISLRGSGPFTWSHGLDASWTQNDEWRLTVGLA